MANIVVAGSNVVQGELVDSKPDINGKVLKVLECTVAEDSYVSGLEAAGLDFKTVKAVSKYNEGYIKQIASDAADAGVALLKENKDADRVVFKAPYLTDTVNSRSSSVDVMIDRAKDINIPGKGIETRPYMAVNVVNKSEKLGSHLQNLKANLIENLK